MYTIQHSYILSKRELFNSNMLSRKGSTQTYKNKRTSQKKYDNN